MIQISNRPIEVLKDKLKVVLKPRTYLIAPSFVRLSTAVHKSTEESAVETSEIDLYETQIKALSEAKDLRKSQLIGRLFSPSQKMEK